MLFALLAFGSIWFWAALVLPFLILIWAVENEKAGSALAVVLLTVAAFVAFGDQNVLALFKNPTKLAMYAGGYVVAGIIWGFVKWFFYVLRARDNYEKARAAFFAQKKVTEITDANRDEFKSFVTQHIGYRDEIIPTAVKNKGRIVFWMGYWPASAFWTLLNDPLTRFYNLLYRRLGVVFENISKSMFGKYRDELA